MRNFTWLFKTLTILLLAGGIFGSAAWFAYQIFIKPNQIPPEHYQEAAQATEDPSLPEFEQAISLFNQRKLLEARAALELFIDHYPFSSKVEEARKALGQTNIDIFFSAIPAPEKVVYEVIRGDAMIKIERKLKTPRELIMRSNNLDDPTRLRVGQILYVSQPEFSIIIRSKKQTVTLLNHRKFFKEYKAVNWAPSTANRPSEKVPLTGVVSGELAWRNGARIAFGSKDYPESERWLEFTVKGYTLYSDGGQKPTHGISLMPEDMQELSTLVSKNVPVSIQ